MSTPPTPPSTASQSNQPPKPPSRASLIWQGLNSGVASRMPPQLQTWWSPPERRAKWQHRLGAFSGIFLVVSVALGFWEFGQGFKIGDHVKYLQAFFLSVWIVVPPIWFWWEYFYLYKSAPAPKPDLDEFKHGQDQSSKIWLALVTVLLGMYFGHDLIREPSEKQPNPASQQNQQAPQPAPLRTRPSVASPAPAPRSVPSASPPKPPAGHP